MKKSIALLSFFFLISYSLTSIAYNVKNYKYITEQEYKSLPNYLACKLHLYLQKDKKDPRYYPIVKKGVDIYGWGFSTLHHYALGLIYLNRYLAGMPNFKERGFYLDRAISQFSFSLFPDKVKTFSKKFIFTFLPSMYFKRGEAYLYKNELSKAMSDCFSAIKINPRYFLAYQLLSECYIKLGDKNNATKILKLGTQRAKNK